MRSTGSHPIRGEARRGASVHSELTATSGGKSRGEETPLQ